jgi:hypothetical protein
LKSFADWYSQPSSIPSPSLSALQTVVPIWRSSVSSSRSLSSSASAASTWLSPSQFGAAAAGAAGAAAGTGAAGTATAAAGFLAATGAAGAASAAAGAMVGDAFAGVYALLSFLARTRSWKRVAVAWPAWTLMNDASLAGTLTTRRVFVAFEAFTKTARWPRALKTTVLRFLPGTNPEPLIVRF